MDPKLWWIAGGIAALPVAFYLFSPILIWFAHWQSARFEFVPVEPATVRPETKAHFDAVFPALADAGFREPTWLRMQGYVPNVEADVCVMVHRESRVVAFGSASYVKSPTGLVHRSDALEFSHRFSHGRSLTTTNTPELLPRLDIGPKKFVTMSSEKDPVRLWKLHEWIVKREIGSAERAEPPLPEHVPSALHESVVEDLDHFVRLGSLAPRGPDGRHFLTLAGAFHLTWINVWPVTAFRRFLRSRREAAILQKFRSS